MDKLCSKQSYYTFVNSLKDLLLKIFGYFFLLIK
jgi:hypothetical protein